MPEPTLDALETVFAQVVAGMDKDEFDSHEFILKLACDHQHLYVSALATYANTNRPFQIVHGEIAKRLLTHHGEVVTKTGEATSEDIFGHVNTCAMWRRVVQP
jgi:hypothetical protein